MSVQIIDNCLAQPVYESIKSTLLGTDFPWYYNSFKVDKEAPGIDPLYDYQFTHNFYKDLIPRSPYLNLLEPILEILNPSAIFRIKANLTPRTENLITYKLHVDEVHFKGKTAIYYVNNNNGYTVFDDGSSIESKSNRLVIFDSKKLHAGTTCTDEKVRSVINFNYYEWDQ